MSELIPQWKCRFALGAESGEVLNTPLTVGQVLGLKCEGTNVSLEKDKVVLQREGQEKNYALKILKIKSIESNSGEFEVVSYEVGEHKQAQFTLTDGKVKVQLEPLTWNVKTVIPPEKQQNAEPYGPFGPWQMSWPLWWWIALLVALALLGLLIWRKARAITKRKKLEREVREYRERHSPFDEFHRDLRQIHRKIERGHQNPREFLTAVDIGFKIFLQRTLVVPAIELGDRALRREIWRRHKRSMKEVLHKDITQFLVELKRADRENVSSTDVLQIVEWAQNLSEKIDSVSSGSAA